MTDPFATLDPHVPLALLPVRLETRFADPGTDVLHVRIFPDDIHVNGHDPALTVSEQALGTALWAAPADLLAEGETPPTTPPPPGGTDGRRALWAGMVRLLGGPRAAWVARATRPGAAAPAIKAQAYATPAVAAGLPDRWLVRAYAGPTVIGEAWSQTVAAPLALGPDPRTPTTPPASSTTLAPVDPGLKWLVDYPTALSVGMAVDVTLPAGTASIDRVVAVGVRATTPTGDGATALVGLLTAHRYTDGLGFLSVGSATANTPDARSAGDRHADPDLLWSQEFGPTAPSGAAAPRLAAALGVPEPVLDGTSGAADLGDVHARDMQTALWPATWGYYLGELLDDSGPSDAQIDAVRGHYLSFVRGRGTLPALRVGRQPYGVLPSLRLATWVTDGASATVDALARLLQRVRPLWEYGVGQPLTAHTGPDFDAAFAAAMSTDAVARSYSVRSVVADRTTVPLIFTGVDTSVGHAVLDALVGGLLPGGRNPLLLNVLSPTAQPVRAPLVVDPRDPTPDTTVQAAIAALVATNPATMQTSSWLLTPTPNGPATVLHTLLRRGLLLEYARAGSRLGATPLRPIGTATMLLGLSPNPAGGFTPATSYSSVLTAPVTAVTGSLSTGEWLWRNPTQQSAARADLDDTLAALRALETLTAAELERLLPEALDTTTHRWTAWAESVAADKLARLRTATPTGVTLGGWGIVERLQRESRTAVDPGLSHGAASAPVWQTTRAGGFVHALSSAQAATAAVLRAGHLAHGGDADPTLAIDLSSQRARRAVALSDGIRAGQELGALLGYELERFLHERAADQLIAPLRAYAPRWQASGTFVEGDATENVSPSAVVDGLALLSQAPAAVAGAVLPTGAGASPALAAALADGLTMLEDHQHALADLLTAESVHQVLAGNTARASGVLDAAHRGGVPPDAYDVLRTPRPGAGLTCRVGVLIGAATAPLTGGWPPSARGAADPAVAGWLATLLPPLADVRVRTSGADGSVTDAPLPAAAAALGPLDLVLDLPAVVRSRVELALPAGTTLASGRDPAWPPGTVGLDELLTVAAGLRETLSARSLTPADLLPAAAATPGTDARDSTDLGARVSAARTALTQAAAALASAIPPLAAALAPAASATPTAPAAPVLSAARGALSTALGLGLTVPSPSGTAPADLLAGAQSAASELARRLATPAPAADASADEESAALQGLLGASQPALPRLALDAAAASGLVTALSTGDALLKATPELAEDWLIDAAGVRAGAGHLAEALRGCEALTPTLGSSWRILDWPAAAGARWTALLDASGLGAVAPATTVVVSCSSRLTPTAGGFISGLLVDEWVEVVPEPTAATAIAYQAEAPPARAPQAILLGLAPDVAAGWTTDAVAAVALEALDLAAVRTVDGEHAAWTGRMLPAVLLPDGDATDVIAAPARPLLQVDAGLLAAARAKAKEFG